MVQIREMTPEDLTEVARLEENSFTVPWSEDLILDALESPLDELWVLTEDDAVTGYCNFRMIAGEGELMRIAVDPSARGKGYGKMLMERLNACAAAKQISDITLEVRASNKAAIHLYEAFQFRTEAVRNRYYTHPVEDALIMWRRLGQTPDSAAVENITT